MRLGVALVLWKSSPGGKEYLQRSIPLMLLSMEISITDFIGMVSVHMSFAFMYFGIISSSSVFLQ